MFHLAATFSADAHVHLVERIGQRADHHVDHRAIAHARAPALGRQHVAGTAHRFRAARHRDHCIAQHHCLRGRYYCL